MKTATITRMSLTSRSMLRNVTRLTPANPAGVAPSLRGSVSSEPFFGLPSSAYERGGVYGTACGLSAGQDRQPWQKRQGESNLIPHPTAAA